MAEFFLKFLHLYCKRGNSKNFKQNSVGILPYFYTYPGFSLMVYFQNWNLRNYGDFHISPKFRCFIFCKTVFFKSIKKIFFIGRSSREKGEGREAKKINLEFLITAIPRMVVTFGCWTFGLGPNYLTTSQLSLTSHEPM